MRSNILTLGFILLVLAAACAPRAEEVIIPTLAVLPSATPPPTETATPTDTPQPTATATTTPTPTPMPSNTPSMTPTPDCDWELYYDAAGPIVTDFLDTADVAATTGRGALSPIMLELQRVWRSFQRQDVPECLRNTHNELDRAMEYTIDGFNDFIDNIPELSLTELTLANQRFWNAGIELLQHGVASDYRLLVTSIIWGGGQGKEAHATRTLTYAEAFDYAFATSTSTPRP